MFYTFIFIYLIYRLIVWIVKLVEDKNAEQAEYYTNEKSENYQNGEELFGDALVKACAVIMRADGRISKSELDTVKIYLLKYFDQATALQYLRQLRDCLDVDINMSALGNHCRKVLPYSTRLELLSILCDVAYSDGVLDDDENAIIFVFAADLGVTINDLITILSIFAQRHGTGQNQNHGQNNAQPLADDLDWAYKILQVTPQSSNDEIKKSYRKLAMKFHPDKVADLGEDVRRHSEEKFKAIQNAYQAICKQRNIK